MDASLSYLVDSQAAAPLTCITRAPFSKAPMSTSIDPLALVRNSADSPEFHPIRSFSSPSTSSTSSMSGFSSSHGGVNAAASAATAAAAAQEVDLIRLENSVNPDVLKAATVAQMQPQSMNGSSDSPTNVSGPLVSEPLSSSAREQFITSVLAIQDIVVRKLYRARVLTLEDYFKANFQLSRAQVYRVLDCASLYLDFAKRFPGLPKSALQPFPIKQRLCKTIRALAPSPYLRQLLWMQTLCKWVHNPAPELAPIAVDELTSRHVKTVWESMSASVGNTQHHVPSANVANSSRTISTSDLNSPTNDKPHHSSFLQSNIRPQMSQPLSAAPIASSTMYPSTSNLMAPPSLLLNSSALTSPSSNHLMRTIDPAALATSAMPHHIVQSQSMVHPLSLQPDCLGSNPYLQSTSTSAPKSAKSRLLPTMAPENPVRDLRNGTDIGGKRRRSSKSGTIKNAGRRRKSSTVNDVGDLYDEDSKLMHSNAYLDDMKMNDERNKRRRVNHEMEESTLNQPSGIDHKQLQHSSITDLFSPSSLLVLDCPEDMAPAIEGESSAYLKHHPDSPNLQDSEEIDENQVPYELLVLTVRGLRELARRGYMLQPHTAGNWVEQVHRWRFVNMHSGEPVAMTPEAVAGSLRPVSPLGHVDASGYTNQKPCNAATPNYQDNPLTPTPLTPASPSLMACRPTTMSGINGVIA